MECVEDHVRVDLEIQDLWKPYLFGRLIERGSHNPQILGFRNRVSQFQQIFCFGDLFEIEIQTWCYNPQPDLTKSEIPCCKPQNCQVFRDFVSKLDEAPRQGSKGLVGLDTGCGGVFVLFCFGCCFVGCGLVDSKLSFFKVRMEVHLQLKKRRQLVTGY